MGFCDEFDVVVRLVMGVRLLVKVIHVVRVLSFHVHMNHWGSVGLGVGLGFCVCNKHSGNAAVAVPLLF